MTKNTKQVYTTLAVVVVVAALIWLFKGKPAGQETPVNGNDSGQQNTQNPNPSPTPTATDGVWTGTLKVSDNAAKGNLMLVTSDRTIYMTSSRDFSSLYGKKVDVSYQGSLKSFVLGSITPSAMQ